ncbi:MAG: tetratricopeptide repeat protein [Wenzhouxiangellaceae bacterium]
MALIAACNETGAPVSRALELQPPPGFEQMDPAVRDQFAELRGRLSPTRKASTPAARGELGRVWGELGQWFHVYHFPDSAMRCYREAARLDPDEPRWPYYRGLLAVEAGDLDQAGAAFEAAAQRAPDSIAVLIRLADLMLKRRQPGKAEDFYRQVLGREPGHPAASIGMARLHLQRQNANHALEALQPLLHAAGRTDSEVHYLAAQAYRMLEDEERARQHLERLPQDYGDRKPVDRHDPWLDDLRAMNIGTNHLTRLGARAYRQGNFRLAATHSGKAAASNPDNPELRTNYAAALLALGRGAEALEQIDLALELDPGLARAYLVRGTSHLRLGDREAARDALLHAVALDGGLNDARRQLGRIYHQTGQIDLAIDQYAELRARYREVVQARFWHAALLSSTGRHAQALAALNEDLEVHPHDRALQLLRIRILATVPDTVGGNSADAAVLLSGLTDQQPDVYFAESAAMVAAALGYHSRAVALQRRAVNALEALPDGAPIRIARRRLTLYREQKACQTPWERGESLITRPVDPLIETNAAMDVR